jgi:hypothetical protein
LAFGSTSFGGTDQTALAGRGAAVAVALDVGVPAVVALDVVLEVAGPDVVAGFVDGGPEARVEVVVEAGPGSLVQAARPRPAAPRSRARLPRGGPRGPWRERRSDIGSRYEGDLCPGYQPVPASG